MKLEITRQKQVVEYFNDKQETLQKNINFEPFSEEDNPGENL
jgi:hypothetical protein